MLLVPHNTIDPTKGRTKTEAGFYRRRPGGPRPDYRIRVPRQQPTVHHGVPNDVPVVNAAQLLVKPRQERSAR